MPSLVDKDRLLAEMYHEAFETDTDMQKWDSGCWIRYRLFEEVLKRQPTVEAVPVRHGHWIKANDPMSSPFDTMKRCLCSECREWGAVTSYCPHCGARMDGEEDGQRDVD